MRMFGRHKSRTTMPKVESDTEPQKQRKRLMMDNKDPPGIRRRLPIEDVPNSIRDVAGSQMNQIQIWQNQHIVDTIQKLEDERQWGRQCSNRTKYARWA